MSSWEDIELGSALKVSHGFAFKGEYFTDSGDLIVLTPGNFVDAGGFKPKSGKEKYYEGGPVPDGYLLSKGDVVVAMTEQAHGLLGSSATIPVDGTYLHNQRIGLLEVVAPDVLDLRFAYHAMNSPSVRIQLQATATGTKVRHTAPERIHSVRVAIPCLRDQKQIAWILDSIDDLIENNRRRVEVLEEMARAIYREWFVHFRFPGHGDATFIHSDLGPIPEGWAVRTLADLVERRKTTVAASDVDPTTKLVGLEHLPRRSLTLEDWDLAASVGSRKTVFETGDILFSKIRPYFHKVVLAPISGICSTDALVFIPEEIHRGQAIMALSSDEVIAHATQTSNGTKMPRANWDVVGSLPAAVPTDELGRRFTDLVDDMTSTCGRLMLSSRSLSSMRDLLLPKLMTGQIDVSDIDLDAAETQAGV